MSTFRHSQLNQAVRATFLGCAALAFALAAVAESLETLVATGLSEPYGLAVDIRNIYYIADSANNRIAKYLPDIGLLTNFVGQPSPEGGRQDGFGTGARFFSPQGLVFVPARGGLVVADSGNHSLRLVTMDGGVTTLAGGESGSQDGPLAVARFTAPAGLAADTNGNVYVADLQNNSVRRMGLDNTVSTLGGGFSRPSAVAVGGDGRIYVADTGNNAIKVIEFDGSVRLLAGSGQSSVFGLKDSVNATEALFDKPSSLLWVGGSVGLLVGDSGNHLVRRVFYSSVAATNSVETFSASVDAGLVNPIGIARDLAGSILITDLVKGELRRVISGQTALPAVSAPQIGYIVLTNTDLFSGTRLYAVTNATFNNDVVVGILAEPTTQTYFTLGATDSPDGVPDPNGGSAMARAYTDGALVLPHSIIDPVQPDVTIKAISTQADRRPSAIVAARFRFQVANPIIFGINPASFSLDTATDKAELWFTTDGNDPQINGPGAQLYPRGTRLNVVDGTDDVVFRVRGFKNGYLPSTVVQQTFFFTNLQTSSIGFTKNFRGGVGATVLMPVEVRLASSDVLNSLQLRIEVRPNGAAPPIAAALRLPAFGPLDFVPLASPGGVPSYANSYSNGAIAFAFVGTNSSFQLRNSGPIALVAATIPSNALEGQSYSLTVLEASGTPDGLQTELPLASLGNRVLTVTNQSYLVGDTAVGDWYNVGDFGDGTLINNDVNNAFYASIGVRLPFPYTDVFDAMDAFPLDTRSSVGGDGQIRFLDWQIILERSLKLRNDNWTRVRGPGGSRIATPVAASGASGRSAVALASLTSEGTAFAPWPRPGKVSAGTVEMGHAGQPVRVPVYIELAEGYNWAGGQFWPIISMRRDAMDSEVKPSFEVNPDLGIPAPAELSAADVSTNNVVFVWDIQKIQVPLTGSNLVGWLTFQIPASAVTGDFYVLRFRTADGASADGSTFQGLTCETVPGGVWVQTVALRPAEQISDEWRIEFFGSVTTEVAGATRDPDGDGMSNLAEYILHTNPLVADWRIGVRLEAGKPVISWYGDNGRSFAVFVAEQLGDWRQLGTVIIGRGQPEEYRDTDAAGGIRYYQIRIVQ